MDGKKLYELLETVRVALREHDNGPLFVPQYVELVRELICLPLTRPFERRAAVGRWLREQDGMAR